VENSKTKKTNAQKYRYKLTVQGIREVSPEEEKGGYKIYGGKDLQRI